MRTQLEALSAAPYVASLGLGDSGHSANGSSALPRVPLFWQIVFTLYEPVFRFNKVD
jgi:hypothetical protein